MSDWVKTVLWNAFDLRKTVMSTFYCKIFRKYGKRVERGWHVKSVSLWGWHIFFLSSGWKHPLFSAYSCCRYCLEHLKKGKQEGRTSHDVSQKRLAKPTNQLQSSESKEEMMKRELDPEKLNLIPSLRDTSKRLFPPVFSSHASQHLVSVFTVWLPCSGINMDYSVKLVFVIYYGLRLD